MPLDIVIVGGGIAGLAAAGYLRSKHNVTVLEKGDLNFDINDYGLSVVANAFNLLVKAGIDQDRLNMVVMTHLWDRNNNNEEINTIDFDTRKKFGGAPSILARRAFVQAELLRFATSDEFPGNPATVIRNARTESLDVEKGIVRTSDWREFKGDLIIGADGINSVVRTAILSANTNNITPPIAPSTGRINDLLAFMTQIPTSALKNTQNDYLSDPSTAAGLVNWASKGGREEKTRLLAYHISPNEVQLVGYASEKEFSKQFDEQKTSIIKSVNADRAQSEFRSDFDKSIWSLFGLTQVDAWRIRDAEPINTWTRGKALLIGDAAHAVTPHAGQGCNISIEDAEALGYLLRDIENAADLPRVIQQFMALRRERTQRVARYSRYMGGLTSKEEEAEDPPISSREEHMASTYGYLGAKHALKNMVNGVE